MTKKGRGRPKKTGLELINKPATVLSEDHVSSSNKIRQPIVDETTETIRNPQESEDVKQNDAVVEAPSFRAPNDRKLAKGFSDIEFTYPNLRGYWATERDIAWYLSWGYQYCKKEWVKDYTILFSHLKPGQGANPNGLVNRDGHTLLVASEEIAKSKYDYYQNKVVDPRESIKGNLSLQEMAQRGIKID
jgi:hypothetical protein